MIDGNMKSDDVKMKSMSGWAWSALTTPATIVIGAVASLADQLAWFDAAGARRVHSGRPADSADMPASGVA